MTTRLLACLLVTLTLAAPAPAAVATSAGPDSWSDLCRTAPWLPGCPRS